MTEQLPQLESVEAAFFDIDRTLVASGTHLLHEGLPALLDPGNRPFPFTEVTARGVELYQDVLHKNPALVPSPGFPVGLEYGTRIVVSGDYADTSRYENIHHTILSSKEQAELVSFLGSVPFLRVAFYGHDPTQPRTLWTPVGSRHNPQSTECQTYTGPVQSLERALQDSQPGMVAVKMHNSDVPAKLNVPLTVYESGFSGTTTFDFLPAQADKRDAVVRIASLLDLRHETLLTAGDSAPDIGMLTIAGIAAVVVRNPKVDDDLFPAHLPRVNPSELAAYLTTKNSSSERAIK